MGKMQHPPCGMRQLMAKTAIRVGRFRCLLNRFTSTKPKFIVRLGAAFAALALELVET